jgi:hypothetical protein
MDDSKVLPRLKDKRNQKNIFLNVGTIAEVNIKSTKDAPFQIAKFGLVKCSLENTYNLWYFSQL